MYMTTRDTYVPNFLINSLTFPFSLDICIKCNFSVTFYIIYLDIHNNEITFCNYLHNYTQYLIRYSKYLKEQNMKTTWFLHLKDTVNKPN